MLPAVGLATSQGTVKSYFITNIGSNTHATIDTHISSTGTAERWRLGNMAVQNSNALSVTGGTVTTTTIGTNTIVGVLQRPLSSQYKYHRGSTITGVLFHRENK